MNRKHAIDIADMGVKVYFVNSDGEKLEYNNIISVTDLSFIEELKDARRNTPAITR